MNKGSKDLFFKYPCWTWGRGMIGDEGKGDMKVVEYRSNKCGCSTRALANGHV